MTCGRVTKNGTLRFGGNTVIGDSSVVKKAGSREKYKINRYELVTAHFVLISSPRRGAFKIIS